MNELMDLLKRALENSEHAKMCAWAIGHKLVELDLSELHHFLLESSSILETEGIARQTVPLSFLFELIRGYEVGLNGIVEEARCIAEIQEQNFLLMLRYARNHPGFTLSQCAKNLQMKQLDVRRQGTALQHMNLIQTFDEKHFVITIKGERLMRLATQNVQWPTFTPEKIGRERFYST